MAHLLVALISYGLRISPCAYTPTPNRRAKRQHACTPYWLWLHTRGSSIQSIVAHSYGVSIPYVLYDFHPN